ncbi:MAG: hypothetical protein JWR85_3898 [Marmoricola sp.]|nr:hypothetical protein [Marmoricola sp.]
MTDKLRVLVRVDLDCAKAQVAAQGHVTSKSVHGLYDVMKRANSFTVGMALELDMNPAWIEPDALEELRTCSRSHHLPAHIVPVRIQAEHPRPREGCPLGSNGRPGGLNHNSNLPKNLGEIPPTNRRESLSGALSRAFWGFQNADSRRYVKLGRTEAI